MSNEMSWVPGEHNYPVSPIAKELAAAPTAYSGVRQPKIIKPENPGLGSVSWQESKDGPWDGPHEGHKELLGRYVHLYRGFHDAHPDDIDMNTLGQHWTIDPSVAERYALGGEDGTSNRGNTHTVLEGRVLRAHLMTDEEIEHPSFRNAHSMQRGAGFGNAAREVPILNGKPIHIVATHKITTGVNSEGNKTATSERKETKGLVGMTNRSKRMQDRKDFADEEWWGWEH